jgi:hypothetical protein
MSSVEFRIIRSLHTFPNSYFQTHNSQFNKRVFDRKAFDPLSVVQVLTVESAAAGVEGGRDDK